MVARLEQIVREQGANWDIVITEFGAEQDHVHILLEAHPSVEPAKFVNSLKTVTSRLLRKEYASHLKRFYWGKPVLWSRSYCLLSAGGAPLETLKSYIQSQETPA